MKATNLITAFFALCLSPLVAQGQEIEMPPGAG